MEISRQNIAYYLTLYFERRLDPVRTAELMLFLSENPDLESLMDFSSHLSLQPDQTTFTHKESLRKDYQDVAAISGDNFDEFCIASEEGLLDEADERRLQEYITCHPDREKDARIYRLLKVNPDATIRFPGRSVLKKHVPWYQKRVNHIILTGIAAAILLMLSVIKDRPGRISQREPVMAQQQEGIITPEPVPGQQTDPLPEREILATVLPLSPANGGALSTIAHPNQAEDKLVDYMAEEKLRDDAFPAPIEIPLERLTPRQPIQFTSMDTGEKLIYADGRQNTYRDRTSLVAVGDIPDSDPESKGLIGLLRDLDAWRTAQYAVKGFNALTESSLSLDKTINSDGKITGLIIGTDAYTLLAKGAE